MLSTIIQYPFELLNFLRKISHTHESAWWQTFPINLLIFQIKKFRIICNGAGALKCVRMEKVELLCRWRVENASNTYFQSVSGVEKCESQKQKSQLQLK